MIPWPKTFESLLNPQAIFLTAKYCALSAASSLHVFTADQGVSNAESKSWSVLAEFLRSGRRLSAQAFVLESGEKYADTINFDT